MGIWYCKMKSLALVLSLFGSVVNLSSAASMPPRVLKSPSTSKDEHLAASKARHRKLMALLPDEIGSRLRSMKYNPNSSVHADLTSEDIAYMKEYKRKGGSKRPLIVGAVKKIPRVVGKPSGGRRLSGRQNSANSFEGGKLDHDESWMTWTLKIESEGAYGLRVQLTDVNIPDGVTLSFFNAAGDFDSEIQLRVQNGEVWTKTIPGNEAFLVVNYEGLGVDEVMDSLFFTVERVGVYNPHPQEGGSRKLGACDWDLNDGVGPDAECAVDYMCCEPNAETNSDNNSQTVAKECGDWQDQIDNEDSRVFRDNHLESYSNSVAHMIFSDRHWTYSCTGGLINNADDRNLLLTANHCITGINKFDSMELRFSERNDKCETSDNCFHNYGVADIIGTTLLKKSSKTDFALFEFGNFPQDSDKTYFALGWTTDKVEEGQKTFRISHPESGPQSYQEQKVDSNQPEIGFIYSTPLISEGMGGSSGSPIVNANNEIVGQYFGWSNDNAFWCSNNDGATENNYQYKNVDGEFAMTYNMRGVADILGTSIVCVDGDACDDGDSCTTNDVCTQAGVCEGQSITCDPGNECSNGVCVGLCVDGDACDDGDSCTTSDVCTLAGVCEGQSITCDPGYVCSNGVCVGPSQCDATKKKDCDSSNCEWSKGSCVPK